MNAPTAKASLNDYLAAERTFLAWIRTGLALMGFGFVVARFGLFLAEFQAVGGVPVISHGFSLWAGTALIVAGIVVTLGSAWSHVRLVGALNRGDTVTPRSPRSAAAVAVLLALTGIAMAVYLTLIRRS